MNPIFQEAALYICQGMMTNLNEVMSLLSKIVHTYASEDSGIMVQVRIHCTSVVLGVLTARLGRAEVIAPQDLQIAQNCHDLQKLSGCLDTVQRKIWEKSHFCSDSI